jgi:hypothetical protein
MTYNLIASPIELTDDQLDMVAAAGGRHGGGFDPDLIDIKNNDVDVDVDILSD